jgi:hypothetical protein
MLGSDCEATLGWRDDILIVWSKLGVDAAIRVPLAAPVTDALEAIDRLHPLPVLIGSDAGKAKIREAALARGWTAVSHNEDWFSGTGSTRACAIMWWPTSVQLWRDRLDCRGTFALDRPVSEFLAAIDDAYPLDAPDLGGPAEALAAVRRLLPLPVTDADVEAHLTAAGLTREAPPGRSYVSWSTNAPRVSYNGRDWCVFDETRWHNSISAADALPMVRRLFPARPSATRLTLTPETRRRIGLLGFEPGSGDPVEWLINATKTARDEVADLRCDRDEWRRNAEKVTAENRSHAPSHQAAIARVDALTAELTREREDTARRLADCDADLRQCEADLAAERRARRDAELERDSLRRLMRRRPVQWALRLLGVPR